MGSHVSLAVEGFSTYMARVGFLSCVYHHVTVKVTLECKHLAAVAAPELPSLRDIRLATLSAHLRELSGI